MPLMGEKKFKKLKNVLSMFELLLGNILCNFSILKMSETIFIIMLLNVDYLTMFGVDLKI